MAVGVAGAASCLGSGLVCSNSAADECGRSWSWSNQALGRGAKTPRQVEQAVNSGHDATRVAASAQCRHGVAGEVEDKLNVPR